MLPNTCYSIRTRKQIPDDEFSQESRSRGISISEETVVDALLASRCIKLACIFLCVWGCKIPGVGIGQNTSQLQEFNHPSSTKPSHDGFEHHPRHDVVIKILLDIHLLRKNAAFCWCWPCWFPCPYLFKIEPKQSPVTANSFQICPFLVKQLLLLSLQYHTIPIYHSRALCKFKVLCFTNLNEAQVGRGTNLFFSGSIGSMSIFL